MHERSGTDQRYDGRWINVYGKGTAFPGRVLPLKYGFEKLSYGTSRAAVAAAERRSKLEPDEGDPKDATWEFEHPRKFKKGGLIKKTKRMARKSKRGFLSIPSS